MENVRQGTDGARDRADALEAESRQQQDALLAAQAEIQRREEDLRNYPRPAYLRSVPDRINIAVTGASGIGKRSLLNAIRRLKTGYPVWAQTGDVETTTKFKPYVNAHSWDRLNLASARLAEGYQIRVGDRVALREAASDLFFDPTGYEHGVEVLAVEACELTVQTEDGRSMQVSLDRVTGKLAFCNLWVMPGVGTEQYHQQDYLRVMGFRHFDLVILMTAGRFTEAELALVRELRHWNVPFFLVRNKIDDAVDCAKIENADGAFDEQEFISNIKKQFAAEYNLTPIYATSTKPTLRAKCDLEQLVLDMRVAVAKQRGVNTDEEDWSMV